MCVCVERECREIERVYVERQRETEENQQPLGCGLG